MDDCERRELQRLRDKFLEIMRRENDAALLDEEATQRIGEAISRSMRQGRSEFSYDISADAKFCSAACKQRAYRQRHPTA